MKSKNIDHYFTQAKRLPITMSFAELSAIVSSKGVSSPPNKSWWNLNNIILMSTLTLIMSTFILWLGSSNSNLTKQYQPKELNYSLINSTEVSNQLTFDRYLLNEPKNKLQDTDKKMLSISQSSSNSDLTVIQSELMEKKATIPVFSKNTQFSSKTPKSISFQQSPLLDRQNKNDVSGSYESLEQSDNFDENSTTKLVGAVEGETKNLTKTIDANELNSLLLQHKNGNIYIETWKQQKIEVTASFTIETKESESAKKALNDFQLFIEKNGNSAKISTNWDELNNSVCNSNSTSPKKGILKHLYFKSINKTQTINGEKLKYEKFKIEYTIKLPENFNVDLSNKYGDIIITDNIGNAKLSLFQGNVETRSLKKLDLTSKYGNSTIGNVEFAEIELFQAKAIMGNSNEMRIQAKYSNVKMGSTTKMNLYSFQSELESYGNIEVISGEIKYGEIKFIASNELELLMFQSKLMAQHINNPILNSSYSKIDVGVIEKLKFEKAFQTDIKINSLGDLVGELKYTELTIGNLKSSLDVDAFQGSINVKKVEANFRELKLNSKYTDIDMKFDPDSKYDLEAQTTYTSFNGPSEFVSSTNRSYDNQNYYAGTFNSASNKVASKVNLNSFQGSIKFK